MSRPPSAHPYSSALLAVLGGLGLRLAFGLDPLPWLAWLAPLPVLVVALRSARRQALAWVTVAGLIGASANAHYYATVMGWPGAALAITLQALSWALVVGCSRRVMLARPGWIGVLAYPVMWAAFDTIAARFLPDGNWASLAHSQADCLPAAQFVALAGVPGLVFMLSLPPAVLALFAVRGGAGARCLRRWRPSRCLSARCSATGSRGWRCRRRRE